MGLNFYLNELDIKNKKAVNNTGFYIYAVRGNHEERPERLNMGQYWDTNVKGYVYYEPEFQNIRYFMDGGEYEINGRSILVIGGAYSVDKWYRLLRAGYTGEEALRADPKKCGWFKDEQLTNEEMLRIEEKIEGRHFNHILAHTCPFSWEPTYLFLRGLDQSTVDNTMERWLEDIVEHCSWDNYWFGHFHGDNMDICGDGKVHMLFNDIKEIKYDSERIGTTF